MSEKFKIMKFGGSVLTNYKAPGEMLNIIKKSDSYPIIIISAFDKTTQILKDAAFTAPLKQSKPNSFYPDKIIDYHKLFIEKIIENKKYSEKAIEEIHQKYLEIKKILKGIEITKEVTPKTLDNIMSYGEELAMIVLKNIFGYFGLKGNYIDSKELIVTDENYGSAKPLITKSAENVRNLIPKTRNSLFTMIPGFTARTKDGFKSTMGFESSNLTAVLIADFLNIKNIQIWTDVEGIRNADPDIFDKTKLIEKINYDEAYKAAINGVKLFYPLMLYYAKQNKIAVEYRSFFKTNSRFSIVNDTKTHNHKILTITKELSYECHKENLDNINEEKTQKKNLDNFEYFETKNASEIVIEKIINSKVSGNYENVVKICSCTVLNPDKNDDIKIINLLKKLNIEFLKLNIEENMIQLFIHNFHADKLSQKLYDILFVTE